MKKLAILIISAILLCFFVSCGNEAVKNPAESGNETVGGDVVETNDENPGTVSNEPKRLSEEEKAKFFKVVEFSLPDDFRQAVVDYMFKCAEIEWVAKEDYSSTKDYNSWGVGLSYKKGTVYHGVPYASYTTNYQQFSNAIVDGQYLPNNFEYDQQYGLGCTSSITVAFQQFAPYDVTSREWIPGHTKFIFDKVGEYDTKENPTNTKTDICAINGQEKMSTAYSQVQKGDIIYCVSDLANWKWHARLIVEEPTIVKNGVGKIIPSRSYVTCIESTNSFDKSRTDGVNTTWYVNHTYTFEKLFDNGYVPYTLKEYSKPLSEIEVPYLGLDTEITSELLSKGMLTGMVKSNFPILYVTGEILDKDGNRVEYKECGNLDRTYKFGVRNNFGSLFNKLEKGKEYTFVLTAGMTPGTSELARVDFTLK